MRIDDRLRDGLRHDAAAIEPDVERHLDRVVRRSRGGSRPARSLAALAASIVALLVLVQLAGIVPMAPPAPTRPPAASPSPDGHPLAGTYRVVLDAADPAVGALGMGGAWTVTLGRDASVVLGPPASFTTASGGTASRATYAVTGDRLYTSVLARDLGPECASPGSYHWELDAGSVRFALADDPCRARIALFTSTPWIRDGR